MGIYIVLLFVSLVFLTGGFMEARKGRGDILDFWVISLFSCVATYCVYSLVLF